MDSENICELWNPPYIIEPREQLQNVSGNAVEYVRDITACKRESRLSQMSRIIRRWLQTSRRQDPDNLKYQELCEALSDYIVDPKIEAKSAKISVKLREEGNVYFKSNDLENALEKYTMSIAFAPAGSLELAMAYANRSAVLFKAKWMSDCLVDIERALQLGYPDNLKAKLFLRKASCHQALNPRKRGPIDEAFAEARRWLKKVDEKNKAFMKKKLEKQEALQPTEKTICYKFDADLAPPKLKAENPSMPGLSDAVKMQYSQEYGRHCVAARDIKAGEVIGVQKPYVNCVTLEMRYKVCWHCGKQTWSSIPCDSCAEVVYCSTKCRDNAQQEYHDVECYVIRRLLAFGVIDNINVGLRITIKALQESNNSWEILDDTLKKIDSEKDPMKRGFTNGKLEPTKFASVHCLSPFDFVADDRLILFIVQSLLIAYFIVKKMKIITMWEGDLNVLKDDPSFLSLFEFIKKNDELVCCNVSPMAIPVAHEQNEGRITSYMLTPAFSFFNHSCIHMITRRSQSNHMTLTAMLPIKKNEQIFISLTQFSVHDRNLRLALLADMGNIKCHCEACVNNWPHLSLTSTLDILPLIQLGILPAFVKSKSIEEKIFEYARKENRVMDFSNDITIAAKTIDKVLKNEKINSPKAMMAVFTLYHYIFYSQRPFLTLN